MPEKIFSEFSVLRNIIMGHGFQIKGRTLKKSIYTYGIRISFSE